MPYRQYFSHVKASQKILKYFCSTTKLQKNMFLYTSPKIDENKLTLNPGSPAAPGSPLSPCGPFKNMI